MTEGFSLGRLLSMGCVCGRETVNVADRRFYIKSRLGEGGFSFVDLVEDRYTHRLFALKRIGCHSQEDENIALQEVEFMRKLNHANLVHLEVADTVVSSNRTRSMVSEVMIVMPFYRRGTIHGELEVLAKRSEHMAEVRVMRLFREICEGLKVLHTLKPEPLAHRDMKPHNVLLAEDDTPILMDFGSMAPARVEVKGSSQARQLQDTASERCSMAYRPPELFNVESYGTIDERTDIWSLGCTLYAMCYHESPFDQAYCRGDSVALAVLAGTVKFPEEAMYSQDLHELITTMVVVNAMERPYIDWVIDQAERILSKQQNRI